MKTKTKIDVSNKSDVGKKRQANEDYFGYFHGAYGDLIIVSDGMGGNKGGFTASRVTVDVIKKYFDHLPPEFDVQHELQNALISADEELKRQSETDPELREMGATAVILLIRDGQAYLAHIGDSRIYLIRENMIHQLTKDHSLVQQLVDAKIITPEVARTHPQRNVITRSLGADGRSDPEVQEPFTLFKDDRFILCTDGLTGYIEGDELMKEVLPLSPFGACERLVAIANERGGKDNITVQIVHVVKGKKQPIKLKLSPQLQKYAFAGVAGAFLVLLFAITYTFKPFGMFQKSNKLTAADSLRIRAAMDPPIYSYKDVKDSIENELGKLIAAAIEQNGDYKTGEVVASKKIKISSDDVVNVFGELKQQTSRKLDYTLFINKSDIPNCFTIAGGKVYISTSLIESLSDKDQIAFLLAHQIAHNELYHALKQFIDTSRYASSSALLATVKGTAVADFTRPLSEFQETEADIAAIGLLKKANLPIAGAEKFLARLSGYEKKYKSDITPQRDLLAADLYSSTRRTGMKSFLKSNVRLAK